MSARHNVAHPVAATVVVLLGASVLGACGGGTATDGTSNGGVGGSQAGFGGTLIAAGAGGGAGTGTAGGGGETACTITACCVPLTFDTERSRLYLVDGQVAAYLRFTPDGTESEMATFDAEIAVGDGASQTFLNIGSFGPGRAYAEVAPFANSGLACGQSVTVELRVRYAEHDRSTDSRLCTDAGPGTRVSWQTEVSCPACPSDPIATWDACDYPPFRSCSTGTDGNPFCGSTITSLPCSCLTDWRDGERAWQCATC
jgi:hypothetical protein